MSGMCITANNVEATAFSASFCVQSAFMPLGIGDLFSDSFVQLTEIDSSIFTFTQVNYETTFN